MTVSVAGLRIGLVTASASRLGGGVFEAVVTHAAMLRAMGAEPQVFALDDAHAETDRGRFGPTPVTTCAVVGPRLVGFAPGLGRALAQGQLDCLHLHGIWMYPSAAASAWAARTGRPYFISPHGMLDPWITARGTHKKALARLGYERRNWRRATAFHALTEREAHDIARETGRTDSQVVPNAGPDPRPRAAGPAPGPVIVYIGRIHAKKNLAALVDGWAHARKPAGARLAIAGWGEQPAVDALRRAIAHADGSVEFLGPVFGETKQALIEQARFVILPSLSEGLPMAMLEAWASAAPTIMTAQCNLPAGFATGAALECGTGAPALAEAIERALALDDGPWRAMAASASACARQHFSREAVAAAWTRIYAQARPAAATPRSAV
ncbi:glycosyltransferase [Novosphingobium bradum]|uniref:Glycosyltransferase n=1 Tax=Novosphingobium bradum TaxID=1737444 RepID=A0ABV7IUE9_9SPHN